MALATPGEGTLLEVSIASTFTEIALVTEFDGPGLEIAAVETTHLTSALHTRRPSKLPDPKVISGKLLFDPNDASTQKLVHDRTATPGTVDDFKLIFNDTLTTHGTATFSGFFTKWSLTGAKVEENLEVDFEIQPTTIITLTPGA